MSVIGYGNIERGDTDVTLSKLQEIVKVLGIELHELFNSQGKVIINLGENSINVGDNNQNTQTQKELEHELEKSRLIVEQQRKELSLVYQEIEHLKEIISLLKQSK
jgi:transcriptional regulator with XRE-family HTH domain